MGPEWWVYIFLAPPVDSLMADLPFRLLSSLVMLLFVVFDVTIAVGFWGWLLLIGVLFNWGIPPVMERDGFPVPLAAASPPWAVPILTGENLPGPMSLLQSYWRISSFSTQIQLLLTLLSSWKPLHCHAGLIYIQSLWCVCVCVWETENCSDLVVLKTLNT